MAGTAGGSLTLSTLYRNHALKYAEVYGNYVVKHAKVVLDFGINKSST